nr:synaptobrevin, longin-like domain protein [Tanacetum cinerariifolium]
MIVILEKGEFNTNFHPMVDFITASPLKYALTVTPTIFVSHIRQFWSTARIKTTDEGTHILAIVDGIQRTVSESSLRRNLMLRDEDGIVSIPDTELFENLTLMGYHISQNQKFTFQKGQFSHQWKYLIHTIMQCLSPKSIGFNEFSSNIATAFVCLATNRTYNFSKMIFDEDEPASPVRDVSEGEACPTDSGFLADQDRATIAKSSTLPHDSAPRVTSPASDEGNIQQTISELMALCTSLQREVAAERISNDSEEIARVLTSMDAATVLVGGIDVPTGNGSILTAGPPATDISTGSEVAPTAKEQQEKEDMRMNEQIARYAEVARIHAEEELQESTEKANDQEAEKGLLYGYDQKQLRVEGSKEEAERLKRKGLNLEQEHVKKQKMSEEDPEIEKSTEEILKRK